MCGFQAMDHEGAYFKLGWKDKLVNFLSLQLQ